LCTPGSSSVPETNIIYVRRILSHPNERLTQGANDTVLAVAEYITAIAKYTIRQEPVESGPSKNVRIWKKQADGPWKLQVDVWNSSVPHEMSSSNIPQIVK